MRRELAAATAAVLLAAGCAGRAPSWARSAAPRFTTEVTLPAPATTAGMPLDQALARRRSARSFLPDPLPTATLSQLLWAGQGITSADGKRTAPSAGALYPLELYVVTPQAVLHYLPSGHRAEVRASPDLRPRLQVAAFDQDTVGKAPDVIVVAGVPARTTGKYGARGNAYVEREAGHATQNILLEATALGLAAVPIGGLDPARASAVLALPPGQTVLYLIPVGRPSA